MYMSACGNPSCSIKVPIVIEYIIIARTPLSSGPKILANNINRGETKYKNIQKV